MADAQLEAVRLEEGQQGVDGDGDVLGVGGVLAGVDPHDETGALAGEGDGASSYTLSSTTVPLYTSPVSFTPAFAPREIKSPEGAVRLEHLGPGLLATTVTGRGDGVIARAILEASDPIYAAAGRIHSFHDWLGVTGYTSEARMLLTAWAKGRKNVEATLLFENRILAMGISVVALTLPGVRSCLDRAAFMAARDVATRQARGAA